MLLRILRWRGHLGFSRWPLKGTTSFLVRETERDCPHTEEEKAVWPHRQRPYTLPWFQLGDTDFELLASGTVREYIAVVLSYLACGSLLQQPQDTNTAAYGYLRTCTGWDHTQKMSTAREDVERWAPRPPTFRNRREGLQWINRWLPNVCDLTPHVWSGKVVTHK